MPRGTGFPGKLAGGQKVLLTTAEAKKSIARAEKQKKKTKKAKKKRS